MLTTKTLRTAIDAIFVCAANRECALEDDTFAALRELFAYYETSDYAEREYAERRSATAAEATTDA